MDENFLKNRLTELRTQKQVSERQMSLDLGHSTSYIRSIASGKALPSMTEFFYICEYLDISPSEFFNTSETTLMQQKAINLIRSMSDDDIRFLIELIERINKKD